MEATVMSCTENGWSVFAIIFDELSNVYFFQQIDTKERWRFNPRPIGGIFRGPEGHGYTFRRCYASQESGDVNRHIPWVTLITVDAGLLSAMSSSSSRPRLMSVFLLNGSCPHRPPGPLLPPVLRTALAQMTEGQPSDPAPGPVLSLGRPIIGGECMIQLLAPGASWPVRTAVHKEGGQIVCHRLWIAQGRRKRPRPRQWRRIRPLTGGGGGTMIGSIGTFPEDLLPRVKGV